MLIQLLSSRNFFEYLLPVERVKMKKMYSAFLQKVLIPGSSYTTLTKKVNQNQNKIGLTEDTILPENTPLIIQIIKYVCILCK